MKNRILLAAVAVCSFVALTFAAPITAKAEAKALPCSYDIINQANAQIAAAQTALNAAQADCNTKVAALNALVASGASELDIASASLAASTAQNVVRGCLDNLNNAKAFLTNITNRANFEIAYAENIDKLAALNDLQLSKQQADGLQNIANAALVQVQQTQTALAGYQQAVAGCPSFQAQIDALTAQLAALQADYAAKQAAADQAKAAFNGALATPNYAGYTPFYIDFVNHPVTQCTCHPGCTCIEENCGPECGAYCCREARGEFKSCQ